MSPAQERLLNILDDDAVVLGEKRNDTVAFRISTNPLNADTDMVPHWGTVMALLSRGWICRHWEGLYTDPVAVFEITTKGRRILWLRAA